jgi:hypothetical protein
MNRRDLLKRTPVILLGAPMFGAAFLEGCTFGEGVDEFISIINLMSPAVDGIVGVVELVDPPVGIIVQAGVTAFDAEIPNVTKLYNDWKAAAAANAPGLLGELSAAVSVLKSDAITILNAAHVKDVTHQNAIDNLINSVLSEITEISQLVTEAQQAGGTTKAAKNVVGKKVMLGKPVKKSSAFKHDLLTHLKKKTGDTKLDGVNEQTAAKIAAIK